MNYSDKIRELTKNVPITLVDFGLPRKPIENTNTSYI